MSDLSVAETVHAIIDQDLFLQEALGRGIVKYSALASWLKTNRAVAGSSTAIEKAAKRYEASTADGAVEEAWASLDKAHIYQNGRVSVFTVQRSEKTHRTLPDLFDIVDVSDEETLRFVPSQGLFHIVVERDRREAVKNAMDQPSMIGPIRDFTEVALQPTGRSNRGAGALGIVVTGLISKGIEVPFAVNGENECFFLVDDEDRNEVLHLFDHLVQDADR